MGFLADWLTEERQQQTVNLLIDDTFAELKARSNILDESFPMKNHKGRDFMAYITEQIKTFASVVAYGAEIPNTQQARLEELSAQLVKSGLSIQYNEELQWRMEEAMRNSRIRGTLIQNRVVTDRNGVQTLQQGENGSLADYLFGNIANLTHGIVDLMNYFTWQILTTGEVNYNDSRTMTNTRIDWKKPGTTYNHFPDALTQTGDNVDRSLNAWDDLEYADGIQTLVNDSETYNDTNGRMAKKIAMSRKQRRKLLEQKSTKEAARQRVSGQNLSAVSVEMLNDLLDARDVPPIVIFDEQGRIEQEDGSLQQVRFLPENKYVFLSEDMGQRAFGETIESKHKMNGAPKSGIYTRHYEKSKDPLLDVSVAVATMLPVCPNDKLLFARQTYTA